MLSIKRLAVAKRGVILRRNASQPERIFIANRGLWPVRISRTCRELGLIPVGAICRSDVRDPSQARSFEAFEVYNTGDGPSSHLNRKQVILAASKLSAKFVHPGIGLLSESAEFARDVQAAGFTWIGPGEETLRIFGNKLRSSELAASLGIPTLSLGLINPVTRQLNPHQSQFLPVLLKSLQGGGGIGLRIVHSESEVKTAYTRCLSESMKAFSAEDMNQVVCETYLPKARHIEVQIAGDGSQVVALGTRECSAQRRFQKIIEVAPAPNLPAELEEAMVVAAMKLASAVSYKGIGTMEFLVPIEDANFDNASSNSARSKSIAAEFFFVECNPRLQVEHTVTEEVMQLDLVALQIKLAQGHSLHDLGLLPLTSEPSSTGTHSMFSTWKSRGVFSVQCRINCERVEASGVYPAQENAKLVSWELPRGPGVRVETHAAADFSPNPQFDSLMAAVVVTTRTSSFSHALQATLRRLEDIAIVGSLPTNISLLRAVLASADAGSGQMHTRWIDEQLPRGLLQGVSVQSPAGGDGAASTSSSRGGAQGGALASEGCALVSSPMTAAVVEVLVREGDHVAAGQPLMILSALKMEHEIAATAAGVIGHIGAAAGETVKEGTLLAEIDTSGASGVSGTSRGAAGEASSDAALEVLGGIKSSRLTVAQEKSLGAFLEREKFVTTDSMRPKKTKRPPGRLTAREIIHRLCDHDSHFIEYGRFAHEAGRTDAVADAILLGIGKVNGERVMLCVYDYTVLAGTQGLVGHQKMDRVFEVCMKEKLPLLLFPEGGGGRAGDFVMSGLAVAAFHLFAKLRGSVPVIGAVSGFCFAGNAALLGMADVVVASEGDGTTSVGMGGPAMIQGAGLGAVAPQAVGPVAMHYAKGHIDALVATDAEMVDRAKALMTLFTKRSGWGSCKEVEDADARLRAAIPDNKKRSFDVREILTCVFDEDSLLELRRPFGGAISTGFARINGHTVAYMASDCRVLSGAIDADAAAKAAQFLQLVNAHKLPLVSFCDTPGFLVGVEAETRGLIRKAGDLFVAGSQLNMPSVMVVLRRAYGLGAMAMCGGHLKVPLLTVSWPSGEFGAMGFEGAIRLGFREQLKADPSLFQKLLDSAYTRGSAAGIAGLYEIDDIIDPANTRKVIAEALMLARK